MGMNNVTFRVLRDVMGCHQATVAQALGVTERTVQRWEADDYDLPPRASEWMQQRWGEWIKTLVGKISERQKAANEENGFVDLPFYDAASDLVRDGLEAPLSEVQALTRAVLIVSAVEGYDVTVRSPQGPVADG
ncbi:hypothetical protein ACU21_01485 [Actinobaculum suis]|nr:hypothetical protein ACU19_07905 [Actinobaculum suis]OCA93146.1 hypothetical protein ACU21_01485 [Actinobaculum suis]